MPQLGIQSSYPTSSQIVVRRMPVLAFRSRLFSASPRLRGEVLLSDHTRSPFTPRPAFFASLLQTKHFLDSTLGWPLRHAWATLGSRLGHPRATQGPPRPKPKNRQRGAGLAFQLLIYQITHLPNSVPARQKTCQSECFPVFKELLITHRPEALADYRRFSGANQVRNRTMTRLSKIAVARKALFRSSNSACLICI